MAGVRTSRRRPGGFARAASRSKMVPLERSLSHWARAVDLWRTDMRTLTFLTLGLLTLLPGSGARAEEATLADGRRREGALTVDGQGRLRFTAADGKAVPLAEVQRVRWPAAAAVPLRVG